MSAASPDHFDTRFALRERIVEIERRLLSARMCWAANDRISERAEEINATRHKVALGSIQIAFVDAAIIKTSALFDDSKRNRTHSLPHLLSALKAAPAFSVEHLPKTFKEFRNCAPDEALRQFFQFAERYRHPPLCDALNGVRTRRDQFLAHFDQSPQAHDLKYADVEDLLNHCRLVLRMAITAYAGQIVRSEEEILQHLSLHTRSDLKRMINALIDPADTL